MATLEITQFTGITVTDDTGPDATGVTTLDGGGVLTGTAAVGDGGPSGFGGGQVSGFPDTSGLPVGAVILSATAELTGARLGSLDTWDFVSWTPSISTNINVTSTGSRGISGVSTPADLAATPVGWVWAIFNGATPIDPCTRVTDYRVLVDYAVAPQALSIDPPSGPIAGGTRVVITGTGFAATPTITFDGLEATDVQFISATEINCLTPAHGEGDVYVVVTNPDTVPSDTPLVYTYTTEPPVQPNLQSSPPWQTSGQWAIHQFDILPTRQGPSK